MTIASTTSKILYSGDGATTVFPISFVFWQTGDIRVIHRAIGGAETVWTEGTHYTISGGGGGTGTLTVITAPTDHTPAAGEKLLIKSDIAELQQAALPLGGAFPSTTVEQMVDIATRLIQQHSEAIARSVVLPETAALSNLRLPEPGAGEVLRYNAAGTDLETVSFGDISTAIDTLLTAPADHDLLFWDSGQGAFVNGKTIVANLTLGNADSGAAAGPVLTLDRGSASPATADILGSVRGAGRNDAAETVTYGEIDTQISDPADGSEDGVVRIRTIAAGTVGDRLLVRQGVATPGALGGDRGADTVNASGYYEDGEGPIGRVLQIARTQTGAVATGTTQIPGDDTIPQQTEGDEYMTLSITPKSASSRLRIDVVWNGSHNSGTTNLNAALFRDSGADALAAAYGPKDAQSTEPTRIVFSHDMASPGVGATTFKVRVGTGVAGTTTFNGRSGARQYGGVLASSITITEYLP